MSAADSFSAQRPWPDAIDPKHWKACTENDLSTKTPAVLAIQAAVQAAMAVNDASHDFAHIARVHAAALTIASKEGVLEQAELVEMIELAALLHDVDDWKYKEEGARDAWFFAHLTIASFLSYTGKTQKSPAEYLAEIKFDSEKSALICSTISRMGFKESLSEDASSPAISGQAETLLNIVQDADRLDAIGAFGIARCLTYGGSKKRRLFDPAEPPKLDM